MIALDTNILVYAYREEMPRFHGARAMLRELAEGHSPWALPWPCVYEFLRVVTHPRLFKPPTDLEVAIESLESLFASPSLTMLGEGPSHASHLRRAILTGRARGNLAHDAHIAALVLEHGVKELWTTDRDFARFPGISLRDPFTDAVQEPVTRYGRRRRAASPARAAGRRIR